MEVVEVKLKGIRERKAREGRLGGGGGGGQAVEDEQRGGAETREADGSWNKGEARDQNDHRKEEKRVDGECTEAE